MSTGKGELSLATTTSSGVVQKVTRDSGSATDQTAKNP